MKDSHLTLRIPAAIARFLERAAASRGVPKSQLVREAVARYVSPGSPAAETARKVSAAELAVRWISIPGLDPSEAKELAAAVDRARKGLPPLSDPWE